MKKYSSNYSSVNNNYIININMNTKRIKDESLYSTYNVLENILQRGNPTKPSKYLLENVNGYSIANEEIKYISNEKQDWSATIKGNEENNDNPAKVFFEEILPAELTEDIYICNLIIPEAKIEQITNESNTEFYDNAVDFYLPQCRLVIEIDGIQHTKEVDSKKDIERDQYLRKFNISVLRIPVNHIKDYESGHKNELIRLINKFKDLYKSNKEILIYKKSLDMLCSKQAKSQFIFDGIMRFQIMILQLLKEKIVSIDDENWEFNIKNRDVRIPYKVAIDDIFLWLDDILNIQGIKLNRPNIVIKEVQELTNLSDGINIDFSLLKKWDDSVYEENIIFIRSDYFDYIDYYKTATSELIKYSIIQDGDDDNTNSLYNLNENIFGFKVFNNGQLPIIINALSLNETIGLLPTGGGKSLCYQLCCLLQPTINFVVVPIKSLMYDQKINLDKKGIVHTNFISSDQDVKEKDNILNEFGNGRYICVWISPERFQIETFRQQLRKINENYNIGYAVIDEVHCLSEWGHDFRTSYLNLAKTIRNLCPAAVFLGLTATASKNVLNDILVEFEMDESSVKTILDYTRKELKFNVIQDDKGANSDKEDNLLKLLNELDNKDNVFNISGKESKSGLIFTPHASGAYGCHGLSSKLNTYDRFKGKVKYYSGEVPRIKRENVMDQKSFNEYKRMVQDSYQNNEFPLLIATKAFGMGIDKGNIRYTIHYGLSGSIESFYQEAGRAGRDKSIATCYILNSKDVIEKNDYDRIFSLDSSIDDLEEIVSKYKYPSGDILRNLFLSINSHKGVEMECKLTCNIYKNYCISKKEIISVSDLSKLPINYNNKTMTCDFGSVQKAIYRLSLLGVIEDWTIEDWGNRGKFKVRYGNIDYESIEKSLNKHINKYDVEFNTKNLNQPKYKKYRNTKANAQPIYTLIYILIQWNYDNVFYARRLSQKNLGDLCDAYFEKGEEYFKEVLEGYFKITDNSFVLDYLANNPSDFEAIFKVLFDEEENFKDLKELMSIKLSLTRFLESYRYNTALNYLSGILGLILNEYDDSLVKQRFNSAFDVINNQNKASKKLIFNNTLLIGKKLDENNKDNLSEVLCRYIDKYKIYSFLQDNVSLNYILEEKMTKLSKVGGRLHG